MVNGEWEWGVKCHSYKLEYFCVLVDTEGQKSEGTGTVVLPFIFCTVYNRCTGTYYKIVAIDHYTGS